MQVYLKKYFWTLGVIVTVVCAVLAARGLNHVVEAKYLLDEGGAAELPEPADPAEGGEPATHAVDKSGDSLTDRNLFCPQCEPPEPEIEEPEIEKDPDRVPSTDLPLELVATTMTGSPEISFATIRNRETNRQGAYWIEEEIPDAGDVIRVAGRYVDFINEDEERVERLWLVEEDDDGGDRRVAAREQRQERASSRREDRSSDGDDMDSLMEEGIRETGDNSYEIEQELVDQVLEDPSQVARGARIVPAVEDGESQGFKLYAIRPNSVFAKVGLNNGDTINEINGFELTSPDKALEVYQRVRNANNIEVQVTRRGEPQTLEYSIR